MVGDEALAQGRSVVVGALNQRLSGNVVLHGVLGGVEDAVVGAARGRVHQTAGDAGDKERVIDLKLDGVVEVLAAGLEHRIEAVGLGNSAGETVEDEAARDVSQIPQPPPLSSA